MSNLESPAQSDIASRGQFSRVVQPHVGPMMAAAWRILRCEHLDKIPAGHRAGRPRSCV